MLSPSTTGFRASKLVATVLLAFLSPQLGCGAEDDAAPAGAGGLPAAGTAIPSGGSGGPGASGTGAMGASAGAAGSAGVSAASGAGTGGVGTAGAGIGGGGSGGAGTAGAVAGTSGAAAAGGSPNAGAAGSVPATFETLGFVITQAPCFGAGCHNDDQNPLDLRDDDQLYTRLTTRISENCGNIPVVNPGNPEQSALLKILRGPCGDTPRMPLGCADDLDGSCVPPEYVAALEAWIAQGAPEQ